MLIEKLGEGATIEEARENARAALGAPEEADITFEITQAPEKKVLGLFGGKKAIVKASYEAPEQKKKPSKNKKKANKPAKDTKESKPAKEPKEKKADKPTPKKAKREEKPLSPERLESARALAEAYTKTVLEGMSQQEVSVNARVEDGGVVVDVECEDHGIVIGRRGETLDAVQYLASLVANKGKDDYARVSLNIGDYRQKREATLVALAEKTAKQVLRTGRKVTLEPMNPYERHIIHTAIQGIEHVSTHSVGSNIDRRVVVTPDEGYEKKGGNSYGGRRDNRGRRPQREKYVPQGEPREARKDSADAPMYGVIKK